ncbi:hypothetical protein [Sphingomonas xinjiangensis]|uniref:Uncharacterized protein n=1 Tax=Sphingomonas xinjiangensis TaxID=643568 RepID=A0A840YGS8_9SPHN|nr:hypothetical protein [Sphingomonas xinjiangensis]MBB5711515.1 hypothetical protein [Sphingomonas xinjiangensis]
MARPLKLTAAFAQFAVVLAAIVGAAQLAAALTLFLTYFTVAMAALGVPSGCTGGGKGNGQQANSHQKLAHENSPLVPVRRSPRLDCVTSFTVAGLRALSALPHG